MLEFATLPFCLFAHFGHQRLHLWRHSSPLSERLLGVYTGHHLVRAGPPLYTPFSPFRAPLYGVYAGHQGGSPCILFPYPFSSAVMRRLCRSPSHLSGSFPYALLHSLSKRRKALVQVTTSVVLGLPLHTACSPLPRLLCNPPSTFGVGGEAFPIPAAALPMTFCQKLDTSVIDNLSQDLTKFAMWGSVSLGMMAIFTVLINCSWLWYRNRYLNEHLHEAVGRWIITGEDAPHRDILSLNAEVSHPILAFISRSWRLCPPLEWLLYYVFQPAPFAFLITGVCGLVGVQTLIWALERVHACGGLWCAGMV
ncbi:hypothetical protein R3P38DRAFT_3531381 [Favolaschia claudopus]|uniref:Uncharacterized protein n=1 Tax=Favolaschia claudopus TaxID=2862362 RepID=A0AAW0BH01_9AGAR